MLQSKTETTRARYMLILVRMLMRCLRKSGLDRRHMAEAALAMRDVMSREEEPSFVIKDPRYVKESTNTTSLLQMFNSRWLVGFITGCTEYENDQFWETIDSEMQAVKRSERLGVAGYINGHVGSCRIGYEEVHGGHGVGARNEDGIKVLDFATAYQMRILNRSYQKRKNHLVTYSSGGRETQIDYIMLRKEHASECRNCKVLPSEAITTQHRILIADLVVKKTRQRRAAGRKRIRWWKLKDEEIKEKFRRNYCRNVNQTDTTFLQTQGLLIHSYRTQQHTSTRRSGLHSSPCPCHKQLLV